MLAKASSANATTTKHKSAAPPPPPPGPDLYDLASRREEGEEEEYGDQGWFNDDPEIDIDWFGGTQPRVASAGAGSFPMGSPKTSSEIASEDFESETYKYKDLKGLKLPALPKDSVGYRSWRNAVLTQFGFIDRTGTARILKWRAFSHALNVHTRVASHHQAEPCHAGHAVPKVSCRSCAWCDCDATDFACCQLGRVFVQPDDCV